MKLVFGSTKQTELEEENWEGHDPNTVSEVPQDRENMYM
jgi:hypothetical protein